MDAERFATEAAGLHGRLARMVLAMCGDRGLAEECAQDALVRAWERVDRGADLHSLEAWTTTVALNACRTQLRRRGAERRALERTPPVREAGPPRERLAEDVRAAVLALPQRQREVVVLHHLLDLDVRSIAGITGTSTGAVKNALFHGRAALARTLAPVEDELREDSR